MWKTTLRLLPLQVVARGGEATLPLLMATWFGGTRETDLYFFALAVFKVAGSLVFAAFQDSALVPTLAGLGTDAAARRALLSSLLGHTLVYGGALSALVFAAFAGVSCVRHHGAELRLSIALAAPLALLLVVTALRTLVTVFLNTERRFSVAPVASAVSVVVTVTVLAVGRGAGVLVVPFGLLAGEAVATALLVRALSGLPRPTLHRSAALRRFSSLVASELLGGVIARVSPLTDQIAASLLGVIGGGSLLTYSNDVAMAPTSLLAAALFPVMLTQVSAEVAAREVAAARASVHRALVTSLAGLSVCAAVLGALASPLLSLVYGRGAMDAHALRTMIALFPYQAACLVPFGAVLILSRAHVAFGNSAVLPRIGILAAATNLLFDVLLGRAIGLPGIALATFVTHTVVALTLFREFRYADPGCDARAVHRTSS